MTLKEKYLPFDEWIYLKIYTGYRTADRLLSGVLYPLWLAEHEKGNADTWFFIRYSDPDFHLRYRIKLKDPAKGLAFMSKIRQSLNPYTDAGLVWKTEIGTYVPEVERYGKDSMPLVEDIFCADSKAVVGFLNRSNTSPDERWLFAMASIDHLLNDFRYLPEEKKTLLLGLSRNFGKEFNKNKDLAKQLSARFREKRRMINDHLKSENYLLEQRSEKLKKAISEINSRFDEESMEVHKNDLVSSIIHMSMNRIFQTNNRLHEMVLYDFLFRYYKSAVMTSGMLSG